MNTYYIDVRTAPEYNSGHKSGALHFELDRIMRGEFPDIPKDTHIAIYCRSGARAEMAKSLLEQNGFLNVQNAGGLHDVGL